MMQGPASAVPKAKSILFNDLPLKARRCSTSLEDYPGIHGTFMLTFYSFLCNRRRILPDALF